MMMNDVDAGQRAADSLIRGMKRVPSKGSSSRRRRASVPSAPPRLLRTNRRSPVGPAHHPPHAGGTPSPQPAHKHTAEKKMHPAPRRRRTPLARVDGDGSARWDPPPPAPGC